MVRRGTFAWHPAALLCVAVLVGPASAAADPPVPAGGGVEMALAGLPEVPRLDLPAPTKEQLAALDEILGGLSAADAAQRARAQRALLEVSRELLPAIRRRIDTVAEGNDRRAMRDLLEDLRNDARDAERARLRATGQRGTVETPDYLELLLAHRSTNDHFAPLVSVVAMTRMLGQIGTVEAARELVRVRVRYEFLRRDVQLQLDALGDRALAALIEAQRHPADDVARWAAQRLDLRGKAIPSETVQTEDLGVLADVLRAYGRIRDPDAASVVISFANSERAQVRLAARQAVRMLGEVGNWQLRDAYENIVGRRPPREWSWERTARELFTEFDRLRLARVQQLFESGKTALDTGKLDDAVSAFDAVLVRSPTFERGSEMVSAYLTFARRHLDDRPDDARRALGRAQRLVGDEPAGRQIESLRLTLEAEGLLTRRVADQVLLRRALELDASNQRARFLLDRVQRGDVEERTTFNRHAAALAIAAVALLAVLVILVPRPARRGPPATGDIPPSPDPSRPDDDSPVAS